MEQSVRYRFSSQVVDYHFGTGIKKLSALVRKGQTVLIIDSHVYDLHTRKFKGWKVIVIPSGEKYKVQSTVDMIIQKLVAFEADRQYTIVGIGGGVISDLAGFAASVYMRGIRFGFVPTTLLAMVDASIGGKNGIDVGPYKNMVGVIRQPAFILFDFAFLKTLPEVSWSDGFAEIIKHACIRDAEAFKILASHTLQTIRKKKNTLHALIVRNARLKSAIVRKDEFEENERRLLNFGHTLGHAIETCHDLTHGQAISIGMVLACRISGEALGFKDTEVVASVLQSYGLPVEYPLDADRVTDILQMDKKRASSEIRYVMLKKIGKAVVTKITIASIDTWLKAQFPAKLRTKKNLKARN